MGEPAVRKNKKCFNIVKKNPSLSFSEKDNSEIEIILCEYFKAQHQSLLHYYILWWHPIALGKKRMEVCAFEKISQYKQQRASL